MFIITVGVMLCIIYITGFVLWVLTNNDSYTEHRNDLRVFIPFWYIYVWLFKK